MCVFSLFLNALHVPLCYAYVCGCDRVFLDGIATGIVKMRRSTREKKTKCIEDLGAIRPSRVTGNPITKKTHQDGRIGNTSTERAVRGSFCTYFFVH